MKPIDLSGLIQGLAVVIILAISIGKYDALKKFAMNEARHALKPTPTKPFFPKSYDIAK